MPLAAHRLSARAEFLRVQQHPHAPAREARALAGIMLCEAPLDIGRPTDIGHAAALRTTAEYVDERRHHRPCFLVPPSSLTWAAAPQSPRSRTARLRARA